MVASCPFNEKLRISVMKKIITSVTMQKIWSKVVIQCIYDGLKWKNDIKRGFGSNKRAWTWVTTKR